MNGTKMIIRYVAVGMLLMAAACDPYIAVEYNLINRTEAPLDVRIYGLRDEFNRITPVYDTIIGRREKINIHRFSHLGFSYANPADTITIFDSIRVFKHGIRARSDFKRFLEWEYRERPIKGGGGIYIYNLHIWNEHF
jgi:hypothetical protein